MMRGFPAHWVAWVGECVSFHSFSILVNVHLVRGWILRQRESSKVVHLHHYFLS